MTEIIPFATRIRLRASPAREQVHRQIFVFLGILARKLLGNHVQRSFRLLQSHARLQPRASIDPAIAAALQVIPFRRRNSLLHHGRHPHIRYEIEQSSSDEAVRRHSYYGECVIVDLDGLARYVGSPWNRRCQKL